MEFLWPGIALVVGFGAGWVLSRMRTTSELARFEGRVEELQGRLVRAKRANDALLDEAAKVQDGADGRLVPAAGGGLMDGPMGGSPNSPPNSPPNSMEGNALDRRFADGLYEETGEASDKVQDRDGDDYVEADDLTQIHGIGAVLQDKLYDLGIYSYEQVAGLTTEETAYLDRALRLRGRIARDDWIGQARRLTAP